MEGNCDKNPTFFSELSRNIFYENQARETKSPSIANTYQNEPQFQLVENLSRNYARNGQQKFADPFAYKQRNLQWDWNGRNLQILNSLQANAKKDHPDVITVNPLKVVGYY